jgi:hypothetical protein
MKKLGSLPYLAIFLANLLVGYLGGSRVLPEKPGDTALPLEQTTAPGQSIPALANGQRSLLLISVDKLDERKPRLTSVWVVLYVPSDARLTLLPIFPALSAKDTLDELTRNFSIHKEADSPRLNPAFEESVRQHIPWWSGFILMDEIALAEIIDIWVGSTGVSAGSNPSSGKQFGSQLISELPRAWDDPYSALYSQASLYQEICWGVAWAENGFHASQLQERITLFEKHLSTDLDPLLILSELQNLRGQGGSLMCEFPTLSVQARIVK